MDYIITHCCPSSVQDIFDGGLYQRDVLTEFFDEVRQRCQFTGFVQYLFFIQDLIFRGFLLMK